MANPRPQLRLYVIWHVAVVVAILLVAGSAPGLHTGCRVVRASGGDDAAVSISADGSVGGDASEGLGNATHGQSLWAFGRGWTSNALVRHWRVGPGAGGRALSDKDKDKEEGRPAPLPRSKAGKRELERLFGVSAHAFMTRAYEARPLVRLRNDPAFFDGLQTLGSPATLARLELVKASKDGVVTARKAGVAGLKGVPREAGVSQAAVDAVAARLAAGESVVANEVQELNPGLRNITRRLGKLTGVTWNANVYVTPPGNTGFTPHWDWTDSVILHVAGRKLWKVCNGEALGLSPGLPNRVEDNQWSPFYNQFPIEVVERAEAAYRRSHHTDNPSAVLHATPVEDDDDSGFEAQLYLPPGAWPCVDIVLTPGSVLYMPRGTVHAPRALGADEEPPAGALRAPASDAAEADAAKHTSLHVTLGLPARQFSWFDAVQAAADTVAGAAEQLAKTPVAVLLRKRGGPGSATAADAVPHSLSMARLVNEVLTLAEARVPYLRRRFPVHALRVEGGKNAWDAEASMSPGAPAPTTFVLGRQRLPVWSYVRGEVLDILRHLFGAGDTGGVDAVSDDAARAVASVCKLDTDGSSGPMDAETSAAVDAVLRAVHMYLGPVLKGDEARRDVSPRPGGGMRLTGRDWWKRWPPLPLDAAVRDVVDMMLAKSAKLAEVRRTVSKKSLLPPAP